MSKMTDTSFTQSPRWHAWLERRREERANTIEELETMLAAGESAEVIASRLGRSVDAMEILCRRAGRSDLASPFNTLRQARRYAEKLRQRGMQT